MDLIVAVTFVSEIGDLSRFENAHQLMTYLGLVPSERSTGETVRRGSISKAGNGLVRHMLVESAWNHRHPTNIGPKNLCSLEKVTPKVREIAWKAQPGSPSGTSAQCEEQEDHVICTAVARELAGFIWAIGQHVQP